jgi:hypothetical protein
VDLNQVIRETGALLEHQFQKAGIRMETDLDSALPEIEGNSGKLQQVLLNLFLNARDAMPTGGRLTVRTSAVNGDGPGLVRVEVSDTGVGIPAEHINKIYDPFFTTKGSQKGTGLGLAVSYGIIREHAGSITVDSQPGRGAAFRLEFPAARQPAVTANRTASVRERTDA